MNNRIVALMVLVGVGCGVPSGGNDAGTDSGVSTAQGIGAEGGTVNGPNGSSLVVPAGALSASVDLKVALTDVAPPAVPAKYTTVGDAYLVTPHGTTFSSPATVIVPFDQAAASGHLPVLLKTTNGAQGPWVELPTSVMGSMVMSTEVTSLSYFVPAVKAVDVAEPSGNLAFGVPSSVVASADGSLYVAGELLGKSVDSAVTYKATQLTAFVAHLDLALNVTWVKQFKIAQMDSSTSLVGMSTHYTRPSVAVGIDGTVCLSYATRYEIDMAMADYDGAVLANGASAARTVCLNSSGVVNAGWPVQVTMYRWTMPMGVMVTDDRVRVLLNTTNAPPVPTPMSLSAYAEYNLGGTQQGTTGLIPMGDDRYHRATGFCMSGSNLAVASYVFGVGQMLPEDRIVELNGGALAAGFPVKMALGGAYGLACSSTGNVFHGGWAWNSGTATSLSGFPVDFGVDQVGVGDWAIVSDSEFVFYGGQDDANVALIGSYSSNGMLRAGFPRGITGSLPKGVVTGLALGHSTGTVYAVGTLSSGSQSQLFVARTSAL